MLDPLNRRRYMLGITLNPGIVRIARKTSPYPAGADKWGDQQPRNWHFAHYPASDNRVVDEFLSTIDHGTWIDR